MLLFAYEIPSNIQLYCSANFPTVIRLLQTACITFFKAKLILIIFLDTEFTSFEEPYLISIGLIAGEHDLYFELSGVSSEICSPFVQTNVLPLLTGPVLEPIECSARLAAFLARCGSEVTFFCDAPRYDITLLTPFLPNGIRWKFAVPSFLDGASEQRFELEREKAFASGLRRHHALDDAKALSAAWAAVH